MAEGEFDNVESSFGVPSKGNGARPLDSPIQTLTCESRGERVVTPMLIRMKGQSTAESVDCPVSTLTTMNSHAVAEAIIKYRGTRTANPSDEPIHTVSAGGINYAIMVAFLHSVGLEDYEEEILRKAWGTNWRDKVPKVEETGDDDVCGFGLAIDHTGSGLSGTNSLDEPLTTQTTKQRHATVAADVIPVEGGAIQKCGSPYLIQYYGNIQNSEMETPLPTVTTKGRHAVVYPVVEVQGELFIVDVRFRMLDVPELAAAQGFSPLYQFTGTKTSQVKQIGNAVPRNTARALLLAHLKQDSDIREEQYSYIDEDSQIKG